MRKISMLLSILVVAAMFLAACGGEEGRETNVPPVTQDTTSTSEPMATEPAVATSATLDTTTTPGVPVTGGENPSRLTAQLDLNVWNQNGDQVGEVDDMVLDLDNSRVAYVVVGTGGFLDLGEKDVLIPWESLQLQTEPGDATGGQMAFVLQGDSEILKNAPNADVNSLLPGMGEPASDWDADIRSFWESGGTTGGASSAANTPETTGTVVMDATPTVASGTGNNGTRNNGQAGALQGVVLASEVLGSSITLGNEGVGQGQGQGVGVGQATAVPTMGNETLVPGAATATTVVGSGNGSVNNSEVNATIDDMIVDVNSGDILYLVLDTNFTDGERWVPVPLGFLQWDATSQSFVVNANANALQNAPFFEADQFPDTSTEGWDSDFSDFWNNNGGTGSGGTTLPTPTP